MSPIECILKKYNWPAEKEQKNPDFELIKNAIGFEVPDDYKFFLRNYSFFDTQIGAESFKIWDCDKLMEWNRGYGIVENLKGCIGIGDNGGGELIALEHLKADEFRVILTPFTDFDPAYHLEIGHSFTDFLKRLDEGIKWFSD